MRYPNSKGLLALAIFYLIFSTSVSAMTLDRIAAKVGGEIITLSSVIERSQAEIGKIVRSGSKDIPSPDVIMPKMLDLLIEDKLQVLRAKKLGLSVDDTSIKKALDEIYTNNNLTEEQLGELLKKENSSFELYKETIRQQILIQKVVSYEVVNRLTISNRALKKYYRVNQKSYWSPGKIHARHILFILDEELTSKDRKLKKDKAKMVLREIRNGKNFEEMAELHSEDISANTGGDLGFLEKGKMVPEFEEAAFSLRKGEVSDIIQTPFGWHIIKVEEVVPGNTKTFDEVKGKIERQLRREKGAKDFSKWMAELKAETFIEKIMFKESSSQAKESSSKKKVRKGSRISSKKMRNMKSGVKNIPGKIKKNQNVASTIEKDKKEEVGTASTKPDLSSIKKKLAYYKKLRDRKKITEEAYQKKKKALLKLL
ncbi:MAG: foldase protein PrsA [Nitrospinales bacterium]